MEYLPLLFPDKVRWLYKLDSYEITAELAQPLSLGSQASGDCWLRPPISLDSLSRLTKPF